MTGRPVYLIRTVVLRVMRGTPLPGDSLIHRGPRGAVRTRRMEVGTCVLMLPVQATIQARPE